MKHVLFAEFDDPTTASTAVSELSGAGVRPSRCHVNVHGSTPPDNEERPLSETDARRAVVLGLFFAAIIGAFMGWLVTGPLRVFELSVPMGIGTGVVLGLVIGIVGGAISGAMNPNQQLVGIESRAKRHGGVVATVEVDGVDQEEAVRDVFAAHGARVETRTI